MARKNFARPVVLGLVTATLAVSTIHSATLRAPSPVAQVKEEPPKIRFEARQLRALVDPRDGSVFQSLTAEGAIEAARSISAQGRRRQIVDILLSSLSDLRRLESQVGNSHATSTRTKCFSLIVDGRRVHFNLEGGGPDYAIDRSAGRHVVQFSPADAKTIYETLDRAGVPTESIMRTLFDLQATTPSTDAGEFGGEEDVIDPGEEVIISPDPEVIDDPIDPGEPSDIEPAGAVIDPECNTCESGSTCSTRRPNRWCYWACRLTGGSSQDCWFDCGGEVDCCWGGGGCLKCKVCGPPDVEPTFP